VKESIQARLEVLYIVVSGAGTAHRMPAIAGRLRAHFQQVIVVPTENASRVIGQREFASVAGAQIVDSYFDELIQPYPPKGVVLCAPCTFNSLNKLASGIADNLALSITAEAIGRGTPVVVALSVNPPLHAHPRTGTSIEVLRSWGVEVIDAARSERWMTLADDDTIVSAVVTARDRIATS
jgi:phosphopantothenoylcysteine synthetase/decarboxylase